MASTDDFRRQLESLYRGEHTAKPSQPIPEEPFLGTDASRSQSQFERVFRDEDSSRRAAVERNNAIQDQQQRQIRANQFQQAEREALDRLNKSRLERPPLELRERVDPKPRTQAITDIGSGSGRTGSSGGTTPRAGGGIPGGGITGEQVAGGVPRFQIPIPAAAKAAIGRLGVGNIANSAIGIGAPLAFAGYDRLVPRWTRIDQPTTLPLVLGDVLSDQFFRNGAPSIPNLGQLPRDLARAFGLDHPRGIPDTSQTPRSAPSLIPFEGGQSPGVGYRVYYAGDYVDGSTGATTPIDSVFPGILSGPISGVVFRSSGNAGQVILVSASGETGGFGFSGAAAGSTIRNLRIAAIVRADGQPDTGGNPAPVADPNGRSRSPLGNGTYSPPAASRLPTAVPLNNPKVLPIGSPVTNPLSPAATAAPTVSPEQARQVNPVSPIIPDSLPNPAMAGKPPSGSGIQTGTAAGGRAQEGQSHQADNGGNIPGFVPAIVLGTAIVGGGLAWRNFQSRTTTTTTPAPDTGTAGDPDVTPPATTSPNIPGFCRFAPDPYTAQTNRRTGRIEALDQAIQAHQVNQLRIVQEKLGTQIPNGGIGAKLGRMAQLGAKTWNFLQVDRVLVVFTWIGVLHNAYMLSSSLSQTLFSAISNGLDAIGIQQVDEDGNESPYDVGQIINKYTDSFAKSIFGVSTWAGIKQEWKALNRIYQAGANVINSIRSITFSMVQILEEISNYTGKIGNSLKRSGTILQNSFNWMNPASTFTNNRFFNALHNTQEAVEVIDEIASETVSVQDTARQLSDQQTEFKKALSDGEKLISDQETLSFSNSVRPSVTINPSDEKKADS